MIAAFKTIIDVGLFDEKLAAGEDVVDTPSDIVRFRFTSRTPPGVLDLVRVEVAE